MVLEIQTRYLYCVGMVGRSFQPNYEKNREKKSKQENIKQKPLL